MSAGNLPTRQFTFCAVPIPRLIYAGPATREEFDRIPLEATVHEWKFDRTITILKSDGQPWERRATTKCLGEHDDKGVTVIFQWFDERPALSTAVGVPCPRYGEAKAWPAGAWLAVYAVDLSSVFSVQRLEVV